MFTLNLWLCLVLGYLLGVVFETGCVSTETNQICREGSLYRTIDGSCNNLLKPWLGMAGSVFRRILPAQYEGGDGRTPRLTGRRGARLPSPRLVSTAVHVSENHTDTTATAMLMQWAQFLDHDLTSTPKSVMEGKCCSHEMVRGGQQHPDVYTGGPCFPIIIQHDDRYFNTSDTRCMEFTRSDARTDANNTRQQYNNNTAWLDASHVYGSSQELAASLRSFKDGKLKVIVRNGEEFLPELEDPDSCFKLNHGDYCFKAGDSRVNVYPGLSLLHTVFLRYHNKMADRLKVTRPDWDDEKLYQETRRIVIAVIQRVTYGEFIQHILGEQAYTLLHGHHVYDPNIDPTLSNVFSTAAYRFGHSLVPDGLTISGQYVPTASLLLRPSYVLSSFKQLTEALLSEPCQKPDRYYSQEMTDKMFEKPDKPRTGFDIVALNVQRGRDHGLPGYNDWREFYGLARKTFQTLDSGRAKFKQVYDSAEDIDLYSGAISEAPVRGGAVGELYSRILSEQFTRLKYGDRFWFENVNDVTSFTPQQVAEISKISLAKVICETVPGIGGVQRNPFRPIGSENPRVACGFLPDINVEILCATPSPIYHK
ncbi:chorion peroxidase-like [Physella acuta]|uniref:chorion peroxidase-like n=1 Tax=Physella acuta TaxID=109671 RepID=UPI0027DC8E47|nr:chorion peroxidase-like [Physella acuta]